MASGKSIDVLQKWIDSQGGKYAVAEMLGINPHSVNRWYYRHSWPKTEHILQLIDLSHGELGWDDVIACSTPDAHRGRVVKVLSLTSRPRVRA